MKKMYLITRFFILFMVIGYMMIQSCQPTNSSYRWCREVERTALFKLKQSCNDSFGMLSSWKGVDCCEWGGVACDSKTGYVVEVHLSNIHFSGVHNLLPTLNKLPSLSVLSLTGCGFDDNHQLSPSYSNFTFLSELYLDGNSFVGPSFPLLVKNMTSLRVLDLTNNVLDCSIPMWLTELKDLERLNLLRDKFNEVEGGLWRIFFGLCHLKTFGFSDNNFQQESFESDKNISRGCIRYDLEELYMRSSGLTGDLPEDLVLFKKLKYVDLSKNALHGSIPVSIGNLTALIELNLEKNQLKGTIPPSVGNLSSLKLLILGNNQLNGAIPTTVGNLSALKFLCISENHLTGIIPATIGNLSALTCLDISGNRITGIIPITIVNLSTLKYLKLSNNQLSGVVPDSIRQLVNLETIDISSNHLTGKISETHFSNVTKLRELEFSSNQLTITITHDWIPSFQLEWLNMGSCKIGNVFPRWLGTQKKLVILVLSNASITGPWPKWFPNSPDLYLLDLSHNQISGHIPHNIVMPI